MIRAVTLSRLAAAFAMFGLATACNEPQSPTSPTPKASLLPWGGTIATGVDLDADGYTVLVDGSGQPVATNGSVTFTGLATGNHSVALSGAAQNCTVSGANPQSGTVMAGGMTSVTFSLSCAPIGSGSGGLTVTTSTTGYNLDPDGYTVTIDGTNSQPIATNGNVTFTAPAGANPVALSGVAANCKASPSKCQDPTRGVEFDAVGRGDEGDLRSYTVQVCDDDPRTGSGGSGVDFFSVYIAVGGYGRSGIPTSGDIVKR